MNIVKLKRVFIMKDPNDKNKIVRLPDPSPVLTPEEVIDHYSNEYPKLQTAVVLPGATVGETIEFEIKDNFGDKG